MTTVKEIVAKTGSKKKGGKGGRRKIGRSLKKCAMYRINRTREKHKVVRIAKSSGHPEALIYAHRHGLMTWAETRLRKLNPKLQKRG